MRLALAFVALGLAVPAVAAEEPAKAPAEKKICRRIVPTGSNMVRSVCRTRAEWAESDADAARNKSQRGRDVDAVWNQNIGG